MTAPTAVRRVVIGDVGGHATALFAELVRLGADPGTGRLPADLQVVQLGDLVHRGPDSEQVVALVDGYLTHQPDQWTQLVGNHEMQYLRQPVFEWPERLHAHAIETMRRWWGSGQLAVAATVESAGEVHLVTHAGVTAEFWETVLGSPRTADDAADVLNSLAAQGSDDVFRAGVMLRGSADEGPVGPLWASAATELVPSWLDRPLPFSQVHGHSTVFDWARDRFRAAEPIRAVTSVDRSARHETTTLAGGRIVGVDPGHGRTPVHHWRSWEPTS